MKAIFNAGSGNGTLEDMNGLIKNVSDTITIFIRQNGNATKSEPVHGDVRYNTVCIKVQWAWIAYPAAVAMLTMLFLAWVVIQSKRD